MKKSIWNNSLLTWKYFLQIAFELNKEFLRSAKLPGHSIRTRYISPSPDCLLCPGGDSSKWNTYVVYLDIAGAIDDPSYEEYVKEVKGLDKYVKYNKNIKDNNHTELTLRLTATCYIARYKIS